MRIHILLAGALCACGSVSDGSYLGRPLVVLQGSVESTGANLQPSHPYVGLVWLAAPADGGTGVPQVFGQTTRLSAVSFPASFTVDVFDPPPGAALASGQPAEALVVAIDDVNGDGVFALQQATTAPIDCVDGDGGEVCGSPAGDFVLGFDCTGGSDIPETCTFQVVQIAPPDVLLGGADVFLEYTPAPLVFDAGFQEVGSFDGVLDQEVLAPVGYHLIDVCALTPDNGFFESDGGDTVPAPAAVTGFGGITIRLDSQWPFPFGSRSGLTTVPACPGDCALGGGQYCLGACTAAGASCAVCSAAGEVCWSDADCCEGSCAGRVCSE